MKVILTTLSNHLYKDSRDRLSASAKAFGLTDVYAYDFEDIKSYPHYLANREIFDSVKFMGYWLWKPLIISEQLKLLSEGDVLIYIDAGAEIIADLEPLIKLCATSEPVLLFGNATDTNVAWTKRDSFVLMDCDTEEFWHGPHCDASISLFRKGERATHFVAEWLRYGSNANILTDLPTSTSLPDLVGYRDHRYDQSILSLLAQKCEVNLYRVPSQFGNHYKMYDFRVSGEFNCANQWNQQQIAYYSALPYYNSFYGQLLNHHRTRSGTVATPLLTPPPTYLNRAKGLARRIYARLFR